MNKMDMVNVAGICLVIALGVGALAWDGRSDDTRAVRPADPDNVSQAHAGQSVNTATHTGESK